MLWRVHISDCFLEIMDSLGLSIQENHMFVFWALGQDKTTNMSKLQPSYTDWYVVTIIKRAANSMKHFKQDQHLLE